jgi:hypothetical protein
MFISSDQNRFSISVDEETVYQGGKTWPLDEVDVRSIETLSGTQRRVKADQKVIARASADNEEAFEEIGDIEAALKEAEEHKAVMEEKPVTKGMQVSLEAMEQTTSALKTANDAAENGAEAMKAAKTCLETVQKMEETLQKVKEQARRAGGNGSLTVETPTGDVVGEVEGLVHSKFEDLLQLITIGLHVLLIGDAGTGKTHAVKQAAAALGLELEIFRGNKHATADDLFGFVSVTDGDYIPGPAYHAVKHGKILYVDEFDVCRPSFIKGANNLTDNSDYVQFPNGEQVRKHEDFMLVGSANTVGQGATSSYTGASGQLDASSLDRLTFLEWEIDEAIEDAVAEAHCGETGLEWARYVRTVREEVEEMGMTLEITPRATIKGAKLLAQEYFGMEKARELTLTGQMTPEQEAQLEDTLRLPCEKTEAESDDYDAMDTLDDDLPW